MTDSILYPFSAIFFGAVLGVAACLPLQAAMNVQQTRHCNANTETHKLIDGRNFWGDTKHCIDRRYL